MPKRNNRILNSIYSLVDGVGHPFLARKKFHLFLASAPKSASTFVSEVFEELPRVSRISLVHGYGEREQELSNTRLSRYNFLNYVAQHHTKYSETLAAQIDQYNLTPVVLVRDLADTVMSICDHMHKESIKSPMVAIDKSHLNLPEHELQEMIARLSIPWFLSFYGSWRYANIAPIYHFEDYTNDPASFVSSVLDNSRYSVSENEIKKAVDHVTSRGGYRFNVGSTGRGRLLSPEAKSVIEKHLSFYPDFRKDKLFDRTLRTISE